MLKNKLSKIIIISFLSFLLLTVLVVFGVYTFKNSIKNELNVKQHKSEYKKRLPCDFSKIPKDYKLTKSLNIAGVSAIVAHHAKTDQFMALVDTGWAININKNDIKNGKLKQKLEDFAVKIISPTVKLKKFEIIEKGTIEISNQQEPYAQINVEMESNNTKKVYSGMICIIHDNKSGKNDLLISINNKGHFSLKVAERFFKNIIY